MAHHSGTGTEIYFIRHGETAWNQEHRLQGQRDLELNPQGIRGAQLIAQRLLNDTHKFEAIYTSDLKRAVRLFNLVLPFPSL